MMQTRYAGCVSIPLFFFLACFSLASVARGDEQIALGPTASDAEQTPEEKFIQDLGDKVTVVLVTSGLTQAQVDAKFHDMLNSAFDVETIGAFVVGPQWAKLPSAQRQEFLGLFKEYVLRIYGKRLRVCGEEKMHVTHVHPQNSRDFVISTEIHRQNSLMPTDIDWVVRRSGDGTPLIVDVVIGGVSQSITQREDFAAIMASSGGDFGALLNALRERVGAQK